MYIPHSCTDVEYIFSFYYHPIADGEILHVVPMSTCVRKRVQLLLMKYTVTEAAALVKIRLSKLGAWYSFSNDYTVMA